MKRNNYHIKIVSSNNTRISSMSKRSRAAALRVLSRHYSNVSIAMVNDLSGLEALVNSKPDLVFLGMKYIPADVHHDKIWLSRYFNERGINYTGSEHEAHKLELNKHRAKRKILDAGLKTSPYHIFRKNQQTDRLDNTAFIYPLFVKPTNRGGGVGIDSDSIVNAIEDLRSKVTSIAKKLDSDSLIEQYLPGREFSVAILKNDRLDTLMALPVELVIEPDDSGERIIGAETKSSNSEVVLPIKDPRLNKAICRLAQDVFVALGARDYGRIDIRLDSYGVPHFLEANLLPSLIDGYGSFPKACRINAGMGYEEMILSIVQLAFNRDIHTNIPVPEPLMRRTAPFQLQTS